MKEDIIINITLKTDLANKTVHAAICATSNNYNLTTISKDYPMPDPDIDDICAELCDQLA